MTPPSFPNPVLDDELNRVTFMYSYAQAFADTYAARVITLVDGVETSNIGQCCVRTLQSGTVRANSGTRVPPGEHVITYVIWVRLS